MADLSSKQGFSSFSVFLFLAFSPFSNLTPEVAGYWSTRQIEHLDWLFTVTTATPLQSFLKVFGTQKKLKIIHDNLVWGNIKTADIPASCCFDIKELFLPPYLPFFLFIWPILQVNSGIIVVVENY